MSSPESSVWEVQDTQPSSSGTFISNVSTKTEDRQQSYPEDELDFNLNIKDDENNKLQQEILDSFIKSKGSKNFKGPNHASADPSTKRSDNIECCPPRVPEPAVSPDNPLGLRNNDYFEYEMELILFEETDVCNQLTILEHKICQTQAEGGGTNQSLLNIWFELISKKNIIFHRRLMLEIMQNEEDLERKCEMLQAELRKPDIEAQREELLLAELLKTVDLRDKLLGEKYKEENILCQEELIGKNVQNILNVEEKKCKIQ